MWRCLALAALCVALTEVCAGESDRHRWTGAFETSWIAADSELESWLDNGNGKLRYDEAEDGLRVNRVFLEYNGRLTPQIFSRLTLNAQDDGEEQLDITEAFLDWRPLPTSAWRVRGRLGAFYPRLSLENNDVAWGNRYGLSSSVINTWLADEVRIIGSELRLQRDFVRLPGHSMTLEAGGFVGNDPTGALLTWRGWSSHDRQTGLLGKAPLPAVPAIEPWTPAGQPPGNIRPFQEIDNRPGYYAGAQWRWGERLIVKGFRYDNRGDPTDRAGQDYAWKTWFKHVGAQVALPLGLGGIGQWIEGRTRAGPDLGPWHVEDVEFESWFATLTRQFGDHRVSVRFEAFKLNPHNDPPGVTNQDNGNALAVSWLFRLTEKLRIGAEYMQIKSEHCKTSSCAWVSNGLPRKTDESQVQLSLRWYFMGAQED